MIIKLYTKLMSNLRYTKSPSIQLSTPAPVSNMHELPRVQPLRGDFEMRLEKSLI
jgi:hypothetical protein